MYVCTNCTCVAAFALLLNNVPSFQRTELFLALKIFVAKLWVVSYVKEEIASHVTLI